ncbi:MAG TPA: FGGY family carbohydrate kinase [Nocardioidaceae bacterium]
MTRPGSAYLGIDLGTSGLKLTVVGASGEIVADAEAAYDVEAPQPGFAETDPADWLAALRQARADLARRLDASDTPAVPEAVGVTGQMHGVVLTDDAGKPVRPAILWPDQRAASTLAEWQQLDAVVRGRLANPISAGMAGPMLTWLVEHEPEVVGSAALVRSPKDWLRSQLTGDVVTERSDASATLLWDVVADGWSGDAASVAGVRLEQLPDVADSAAVVGSGDWGPIDAAGHDVPVVAGGADTACALLAVRSAYAAENRDAIVVNVGTGIQLVRTNADPVPRQEPSSHLYADADGGWYEMLAIQNGGLALSWAQRRLDLDWTAFVAAAQASAVGAADLSFLPFVTGERGAIAPPQPRVGWVGRDTLDTGAQARAAFEALAFTIRRGVELLGSAAADAPLVVSGGGARDPWVRQLVSDVLGRPLTYVPLRSASAVGAAVLAARGVGSALPVAADPVDVLPTTSSALDDAYHRWLDAIAASGRAQLAD